MNVETLKFDWKDNPEYHNLIHERFVALVNDDPLLNKHRTYIEDNIWGFGERSFHWMWKMLVDAVPNNFKFLEIGIFRGQVLSLIYILSQQSMRSVERFGISPLDSTGDYWKGDYRSDIEVLHHKFSLPLNYTIYQGLSTDPNIAAQAISSAPYDIVYIDGGHTKEVVDSDLSIYPLLVKHGGFLVIDDCASDLHMKDGYFQGHQVVTESVNEYMSQNGKKWEFMFNVVHNKVWRRI